MFALNIEKKILDFKTISKVVSSYLSSKEKVNKVKPKVNENYPEIEHDGELYDRARDPPGQRSIYIPPGETSSESYRLSTYIKFPVVSPVNPRQLASSGFYFTGYKDRVKCFSCSLCVENWVQGDDVRLPRWHRDNCDFIHGRDQTNFPILRPGMRNDSTPFNTMPAVSGRPSAGELLTGRRPLGGAPLNANVTETTSTGGGVGGNNGAANFQTARPMIQRRTLNFLPDVTLSSTVSADFERFLRGLDLRNEQDRARTYDTWTRNGTANQHQLARSGFFFLGNSDRVQCFSCAGVLRNWSYGDDVDSEHRRHFPTCRMMTGTEARNVPINPPSLDPAGNASLTPEQRVCFSSF